MTPSIRKHDLPLPSAQPDPRVLTILAVIQLIFLSATATVAGCVLVGWLVPAADPLLPHGWDLMKVNSSLLTLASCLSLLLWQPRRSKTSILTARILAILVVLLAFVTLVEYAAHLALHLDTFLAADATSPLPGRLSKQNAWSFLLIGTILANLRARKGKLAVVIDVLTLALFLLVLTFMSGYLYGALHLYGLSNATRIAPQTLFCVALLTGCLINRRAEYGALSILLGSGIGGRTARTAAPWAILLPFSLAFSNDFIQRFISIPVEYCRAVAASILAVVGFCLVIELARRNDQLENATRELSLRDELTGLYNRRGFYFLAEQAHLLANRAACPFFVLFIDMDNLKLINDSLGHDIGSERLVQLSHLLETTFRETDVIGRLGGDEFVVAGRSIAGIPDSALDRLEKHTARLSIGGDERYGLNFSLGCVIAPAGSGETLEALVDRADAQMYAAKRRKKEGGTSSLPGASEFSHSASEPATIQPL